MTINLRKGDSPVILEKAAKLRLRCSWSSNTDYDLYALILMADGRVETVATFPAKDVPKQESVLNGAVRHLGDVGRGVRGTAEEIIEITMTPEIRAIIPCAYSAQSNGTGSFYKYQVSMEVDGGNGQVVTVSAANASKDKTIYTCVPGMLENTPGGVVVRALEWYSKPRSERRPQAGLDNGQVTLVMDAGPKNRFK